MHYYTLEKKMRQYEKEEPHVLPNCYFVARVDGKCFHTLCKLNNYTKPYDEEFHTDMKYTAKDVANEFGVKYAYTYQDEISYLFGRNEKIFNRRIYKLVSIIASETTRFFNKYIDAKRIKGSFDCKIITLPTAEDVLDYFSWRQEDCFKNFLTDYCKDLYQKNYNKTPKETHEFLLNNSNKDKIKWLYQNNIKLELIPTQWYRGTAIVDGCFNFNLDYNQKYRDYIKDILKYQYNEV